MTRKATDAFDFTPYMDVTKWATQFKMPMFDAESIMTMQRKNMEAFVAANKIAVDGAQAIAQRQVELAQQAAQEFTKLASNVKPGVKPEEALAKNAEMARDTYTAAIANAKELAELGAKSQGEAFEVLSKRLTENFDEVKTVLTKAA